MLRKKVKKKVLLKPKRKGKPKKSKKPYPSYLIEDPSIRHEAHSQWEAEDIYDEDDFED